MYILYISIFDKLNAPTSCLIELHRHQYFHYLHIISDIKHDREILSYASSKVSDSYLHVIVIVIFLLHDTYYKCYTKL